MAALEDASMMRLRSANGIFTKLWSHKIAALLLRMSIRPHEVMAAQNAGLKKYCPSIWACHGDRTPALWSMTTPFRRTVKAPKIQ